MSYKLAEITVWCLRNKTDLLSVSRGEVRLSAGVTPCFNVEGRPETAIHSPRSGNRSLENESILIGLYNSVVLIGTPVRLRFFQRKLCRLKRDCARGTRTDEGHIAFFLISFLHQCVDSCLACLR